MGNGGLDDSQAGSRLMGKISITSGMQINTTVIAESEEETKETPDECDRRE